jgi:hypothetical protein
MAGLGELTAESWDDPGHAGRAFTAETEDLPQELLTRIRAEDSLDPCRAGIAVLRDLLRIETRESRVRRILRVWEGKVLWAIQARDLDGADAWLKAVINRPTFAGEFVGHVQNSVRSLARPSVIDDLLGWLLAGDELEKGAQFLASWGEPVVNRIVELMAMDDPPIGRRHQVDLLALIGRSDTRLLIIHLNDERWFIVRNMAVAIGRTGRLQGVGPLRSLLTHPDARVRVEALRGLAVLDSEVAAPDLVNGFRDDNPRVRHAAVTLLRASPSPQIVPLLAGLVGSGRMGGAETERLVEIIGERTEPEAEAALRELAAKRFAKGSAKVARDVARDALERRFT